MKKIYFSSIFVVLLCLGLVGVQAAHHEGEWHSLFNGENLDGWTVQGLSKAGPKIEDGIMKLDSWDYWAVITKQEYGDFVLQFDVRFEPSKKISGEIKPSNSGVLIHCPPIDHDFKQSLEMEVFKKTFEVQVAFNHGEEETLKPCGTLFVENGAFYEVDNPVQPKVDDWNQVKIQYEDHKLTFVLNGETVYENLDMSQFDEIELKEKGTIAFQYDDFASSTWFKNIMIKELP
jgi:hypothetical protein